MRVAVLCSFNDQPVEAAVRRVMADRGVEVRFCDLTHERFAPCQGCFECWVVHPGTCKAKDHANEVMRDIVVSDAVIWLVRPRFGAWDPVAKAALDKTIGGLVPGVARSLMPSLVRARPRPDREIGSSRTTPSPRRGRRIAGYGR